MERSGAVRIMPTTVMTIKPMQSVSAVLTRGSRGFLDCSTSIVPDGGVGIVSVRTRAAALAGPALEPILAHERALAVAALRDREDGRGGVGGDRLHTDHVVPLIQGDAAHAVGGAAHRPDVLFLEADDDPIAGAEQNLSL